MNFPATCFAVDRKLHALTARTKNQQQQQQQQQPQWQLLRQEKKAQQWKTPKQGRGKTYQAQG